MEMKAQTAPLLCLSPASRWRQLPVSHETAGLVHVAVCAGRREQVGLCLALRDVAGPPWTETQPPVLAPPIAAALPQWSPLEVRLLLWRWARPP